MPGHDHRTRALRTRAPWVSASVLLVLLVAAWTPWQVAAGSSTANVPNQPTWWNKYQFLSTNGAQSCKAATTPLTAGANVDVSNECGPQSETYITVDPSHPSTLIGGSNEIFRLPMRGYYSSDGGTSWGGVDLPLPPPLNGTNDTRFGSDPTLAVDTHGNVYYGYIVVFFGNGGGVNGSEMAVARSTDGGRTYPQVTYFSFSSGSDHFNDKPMITVDTNPKSPYRDNVYIAWDASSGGSSAGGLRVATSTDHGLSFSVTRADNPSGPGKAIGAVPFVAPGGDLYVAWNDYAANQIALSHSADGGASWGAQTTVATKRLSFALAIPAEYARGALVYPACDSDRSTGSHRGRLYCSWMDQTAAGTTDIFLAYSDNQGRTWSAARPVTDQLPFAVDRFNHWLSTDPVTGDVNVSFYDTRNDTTGQRYMTDIYFSQSKDGGVSWSSPDVRVSNVSSNEHDCNGIYPCSGVNYGDQQGDYAGLVSYGGVSHPLWVDSRNQQAALAGCGTGLAMEEVFTAAIK